jgi:hypothetical protein
VGQPQAVVICFHRQVVDLTTLCYQHCAVGLLSTAVQCLSPALIPHSYRIHCRTMFTLHGTGSRKLYVHSVCTGAHKESHSHNVQKRLSIFTAAAPATRKTCSRQKGPAAGERLAPYWSCAGRSVGGCWLCSCLAGGCEQRSRQPTHYR